jgi:hypothetical protein
MQPRLNHRKATNMIRHLRRAAIIGLTLVVLPAPAFAPNRSPTSGQPSDAKHGWGR